MGPVEKVFPLYLVETSDDVEIHKRFSLQFQLSPLYCHSENGKEKSKTLDTGELFLETLRLEDEAGVERCFDYYILLEHLELEEYSGESYGVKIEEKETGEVAVAPHVTCRSAVIYQLAQILLVNQVTPCTLVDVIQDWIA